jgi:hypothetical protein
MFRVGLGGADEAEDQMDDIRNGADEHGSDEHGADERFALALGRAVIAAWADLPQAVQHKLFEKAVVAGHCSEKDEALREELAEFLHDHHPRTA